jgi:hypothetical protein
MGARREMAVLRNRQYIGLFRSRGTLARLPIDGGAAHDLLEDVQEADWSPDGTELAVVRWVNGQSQNVIPILLFLGWTGIDLDINTSLVASVVLGLAVDNAVHFIWRHRAWRRRGADRAEALKQAIRQTGKPIIFANGTLVLAFSIFALSTFPPVRIEGLLAALTILACLLCNLIFLPALIIRPLFKLNELA